MSDAMRYRNVGPVNLESGEVEVPAGRRVQNASSSSSSFSTFKYFLPLAVLILMGFWALNAVLFKDVIRTIGDGGLERSAGHVENMDLGGSPSRRADGGVRQMLEERVAREQAEAQLKMSSAVEAQKRRMKELSAGANMAMQER
jgi:hypothetical protein